MVSGVEEDLLGLISGYVVKCSMIGIKIDMLIFEILCLILVVICQQMIDCVVYNFDDVVCYMFGVVVSSFGSDICFDWLKVCGFKLIQFFDGLLMVVGVYNNLKLEIWNLECVVLLCGLVFLVYGQILFGGMFDMVSLCLQNVVSYEVKVEVGNYNYKQVSFDSIGLFDDEGCFFYCVFGVVCDSNIQVDYIDDKCYNIVLSLIWNIDDDIRLIFFGQFNCDDIGIISQFLLLCGIKYDVLFGKVFYYKNFGDLDWEYYDCIYYWLGYVFEWWINDVWQFCQNLCYLCNDLLFQGIIVGIVYVDGILECSIILVDEDVSQFVVDNNFQVDFEIGVLCYILLLGLDYNCIDN